MWLCRLAWAQLLANLFGAMTLPDSAENDYLMKCIMRTVASLGASAPWHRIFSGFCRERCVADLAEARRMCASGTRPSTRALCTDVRARLKPKPKNSLRIPSAPLRWPGPTAGTHRRDRPFTIELRVRI